ncbi:MAG: GNAT family N-acetyltransferase [Deltaproteobacteria bacterium]|nr:GNAT family N-acetyltransferase [Deltaproteobacteria bacterium]
MGVEIRPANKEEMKEFRRSTEIAFLPSPTEQPELETQMRPEWTLCAFEDGKLATSYAAWPFTISFNGKGIAASGVTSVGTLPHYRRRGYLRKITALHFEQLHEEKTQPLAILGAMWVAIYQRYGYAVVSTYHRHRIEPRYLQFPSGQTVPGRFHEAPEKDPAVLKDIYKKFVADKTGYIHRVQAMWEHRVLVKPAKGKILRQLIYEEDAQPLGYVIYEAMHHPNPEVKAPPYQRMHIRDLAWLSISAYQAIWDYFAQHDVARDVVWQAPVDDPLPHLLLEPRMLNTTTRDAILGRIIDVDEVLSGREYPGEGELFFEIVDDGLCPWNNGRWKLETSGPESSVTSSTREPEMIMPISTMAMLAFGQVSAVEAARMGRLEAKDQSVLPKWDRMMRTMYRPFCPDEF